MLHDRASGQWRDTAGLVHAYVARKTVRGWYHIGTVCLMYEDMYMETLPSDALIVTCLTCLYDPKDLLKGCVP